MHFILLEVSIGSPKDPRSFLVVFLPILIISALIFLVVKYRTKLIKYQLIFGGVSTLIGAILTVYGAIQRNSVEYKLASVFGAEETGMIDVVFYIGIVIVIIGLALLITDYIRKNTK